MINNKDFLQNEYNLVYSVSQILNLKLMAKSGDLLMMWRNSCSLMVPDLFRSASDRTLGERLLYIRVRNVHDFVRGS